MKVKVLDIKIFTKSFNFYKQGNKEMYLTRKYERYEQFKS